MNFLVYNSKLANKVGVDAAIILGELANEQQTALLEDGYFCVPVEKMQKKTALSEHRQRKALAKLMELGLLNVERRGIPPKRFIKINEEAIASLLAA